MLTYRSRGVVKKFPHAPARKLHHNRFSLLPGRGMTSRRTERFLNNSPAKGPDGTPARQVGFMSTQKREDPSTPATTTSRRGSWGWQHMSCTERAGVARHVCAAAKGQTAPLMSIFWSAVAWLVTKFLQPDRPDRQLARPRLSAEHRGSPPPLVRSRVSLTKQASPRSSNPHIPDPSGPVRLRPPLPQFRAARHGGRRTERYDGKRDMYFQHAA